MIEGDNPLKLVLTGSCVAQLPVKEVRSLHSKINRNKTERLIVHGGLVMFPFAFLQKNSSGIVCFTHMIPTSSSKEPET